MHRGSDASRPRPARQRLRAVSPSVDDPGPVPLSVRPAGPVDAPRTAGKRAIRRQQGAETLRRRRRQAEYRRVTGDGVVSLLYAVGTRQTVIAYTVYRAVALHSLCISVNKRGHIGAV